MVLGGYIAKISVYDEHKQETQHEMRIPKRDVTSYLHVYLLTLIHRYPVNRNFFTGHVTFGYTHLMMSFLF